MSTPIVSAEVCDLTSRSSRHIAQTVSRTWQNFDPTVWYEVPEFIDLRPDGTGSLCSSFAQHTRTAGRVSAVATQEITWKLRSHEQTSMGDTALDEDALYGTIPKLMQSERAWTHKPWKANYMFIPAHVCIQLVGENSLKSALVDDFTIDTFKPGVHLPVEIIECIMALASAEAVAAQELLYVCKWTREMVLSRRRKRQFADMTQNFQICGLTLWIHCGHFIPPGNPMPSVFYAFFADTFKPSGGYYLPEIPPQWDTHRWENCPRYYSCELPILEAPTPEVSTGIQGEDKNDEHPEVEKSYLLY